MYRLAALALLLVASGSAAQDTTSMMVEGRKRWGYKDSTGAIVIPCKYQDANPFREGFASVKFNNRWGFINKTGKEITPFKYDPKWDGNQDYSNYGFNEGLAAVQSNGKCGYIDKSGKEVIPLIYTEANWFNKGSASVTTTLNKKLLIDKSGRNLLKKPYESVWGFNFDRAVVILNKKYGFIDRLGKEIVPLKYDAASDYSDGVAVVSLGQKETIIDLAGKEIIPFQYGSILSFSDSLGMVRMKSGGATGFINQKGELVIPMVYEDACYFELGRSLVRKGGVWGLIDKTGAAVTEFKYEDEGVNQVQLGPRYRDGVLELMYKGKYGYIDVASGKEIIPFKYERAWPFYDGRARVMYKNVWYYVDRNGKETIDKDQ
jgi:hypothetical protein